MEDSLVVRHVRKVGEKMVKATQFYFCEKSPSWGNIRSTGWYPSAAIFGGPLVKVKDAHPRHPLCDYLRRLQIDRSMRSENCKGQGNDTGRQTYNDTGKCTPLNRTERKGSSPA